MRKSFAVLLLLVACATVPARDHTAAIGASRADVAQLVATAHVPGAAVAVSVGDAIVWHDTFGHADVAAKKPVTAETRFRIGSVTKILTATALMRLVEEGRVQLDDPVSKYLPDFPHGAITLRQLAAHTGGIRHYRSGEFLNTQHFDSATASLARFAGDPLLSPPGAQYSYTTYGYNVLGAVIERVTGQAFDRALQALVFAPMGMRETTFAADAHTTTFYERGEVAPIVDLSDRLPAGAALSTARDLARLLIGTAKLPATTMTTFLTPQKTNDGTATIVGAGWRVAKDDAGRTFLHHGGQSTGGRAFVLVYPKERVGVAFVSNMGGVPFAEKDAQTIAARFLPDVQ
ncbi:MAG TPA: serine hydrolase domain-containing protein [Thermoanaerobaculia bacterium]|nr:serine hydrolase domain-containing protein [Thermoanaerobaculia bacterium]